MTTEAMVVPEPAALARRQSVLLEPVMNVALAKKRLDQLQEFCAGYLQESTDGGNDGGDYGVIPGAGKKKVLLKSGADKLCDVYALADTYVMLSKTEDFESGLFDYTLECRLLSKIDDSLVGSGLGSCSSYETKYRYRESGRACPKCGASSIVKGKEEYGGGWLCFAKKGGCGAKFKEADASIVDQKVGRVENLDIVDTKNTVLKMAKKRAKIDAVIGVTRSSGLFTQDLEDLSSTSEPATVKPVGPRPASSQRAPVRRSAAPTDPRDPDDPLPGRGSAPAGVNTATGEIIDVEAIPGPDHYRVTNVRELKTGDKNGTAWTLFGVTVHTGHTFLTFSSSIADQADAAKQSDAVVVITTEPSKKGTDRLIVSIELPSAPGADIREPGEEG